MKGFLQEYGIIMVVVAVVLGMLTFGKMGYAKNIQDAILGSADHIVETGENIVPKPVKASDTIEIEGSEYIVLESYENNQALIITASSIGEKKFQSTDRSDGQNINTYEGSEIDNYLENEWYGSLSSTMKAAIQTTNIKQASYEDGYHPESKQEIGYGGQVYNTINRHVFLPSVSEIEKVVDLKNPIKVGTFINNAVTWTRDSSVGTYYHGKCLQLRFNTFLSEYNVKYGYTVRPTFVIDLSQIDYKVTGHADYK